MSQVIGLIGGLSWKSSAEYYRLVNEGVRDRLGGLHSARCLMWSFDFADIEVLQRTDRWDDAAVPDDLHDIAELLNLSESHALKLLHEFD